MICLGFQVMSSCVVKRMPRQIRSGKGLLKDLPALSLPSAAQGAWSVRVASQVARSHRIIHAAQCLRHSSCPGIRLKKNVDTSIKRPRLVASFGEPLLWIKLLQGWKV